MVLPSSPGRSPSKVINSAANRLVAGYDSDTFASFVLPDDKDLTI